MTKILVTGGAGFIGANLVRSILEKKEEIHLILSQQTHLWRIQDIQHQMTIHYGDLTEKEQVDRIIRDVKPDVIYHLATHGAYAYQNEDERIIQTNLIGFMNLLNACRKYGFKKFINTGSSSEYGHKEQPMHETDLLDAPYSCYAFTKASATLYAQYIAKKEDLPIVTLRLFTVYGDYENPKRFVPLLITNCLKNISTQLASPKTARDFIYVKDVVEAYESLTKADTAPGEIFNVGSGQQHTLQEIVDTVLKLIHTNIVQSWNSFPSREWDTQHWQSDITKIKEKTLWRPVYDLEKGLERTIHWIKNNF